MMSNDPFLITLTFVHGHQALFSFELSIFNNELLDVLLNFLILIQLPTLHLILFCLGQLLGLLIMILFMDHRRCQIQNIRWPRSYRFIVFINLISNPLRDAVKSGSYGSQYPGFILLKWLQVFFVYDTVIVESNYLEVVRDGVYFGVLPLEILNWLGLDEDYRLQQFLGLLDLLFLLLFVLLHKGFLWSELRVLWGFLLLWWVWVEVLVLDLRS